MQNLKRILGTMLLAVMMTLVAVPAEAYESVSCSTNPCAETDCANDGASAYAYGNEYAHAKASANGIADSETEAGGGTASAERSGREPTTGYAHAKKDWSLKYDKSKCASGEKAVELIGALADDGRVVEWNEPDLGLDTLALASGFSVGCLSDETITKTESFVGRVYLTPEGTVVLYDQWRDDGFALNELSIKFDGSTLSNAEDVDTTGLTPLNVFVTADLVVDEETGGRSCDVKLWS